MKATARAHPIQGLLKYHGLRDADRNVPYHDSISVCTAPSRTVTTVEFGYERDTCLVDGHEVDEEGFDRVTEVLDLVRDCADVEAGARVESKNTFESNVGLGASASAFAALARAATDAAGLDPSRDDLSRLARRGATSAARSVVGGFAHLRTSTRPEDCTATRIPSGFGDDLRTVVGRVPVHKHTSRAHEATPQSPLFRARLARVHDVRDELRAAIRDGDFAGTFGLAERDSIELLGVTMTGPDGWLYWRPETRELLELARELRESGVPVYFSADTGATAYLNTTAAHADRVAAAVEDLGLDTRIWRVGGGVETIDAHQF